MSRTRQTLDSQGQILALAFRQKSLQTSELFPLRSKAGCIPAPTRWFRGRGFPDRSAVQIHNCLVQKYSDTRHFEQISTEAHCVRRMHSCTDATTSRYGNCFTWRMIMSPEPNAAHIRQSRLDYVLGLRTKVLKNLVRCSLLARKRPSQV